MKTFQQFLQEIMAEDVNPVEQTKVYAIYKAPRGLLDDESMVDDLANELMMAGYEWEMDFWQEYDALHFMKKPNKEVDKILKSLRFKKIK